MGAGASASSQASLFTAEQKAEIKKQVGVSTSKKWQDASKAEGDSPHTPQTHMVRQRYDPGWYGRNGSVQAPLQLCA